MAADTGLGSYDAWQRKAIITVSFKPTASAATDIDFQALTETIDIDVGERDLDVIQLVNANQITKHGPMGVTTVTFEGYPKSAGSAAAGAADGWWDMFAEYGAKDTSDPYAVTVADYRHRCRVAILWTNLSGATSADVEVTAGSTYEGIRFVLADCFCTSCKTSFTDGILKWTMTFKGAAFDTAGAGNIRVDSVKLATATKMTALTAYVPKTTKW